MAEQTSNSYRTVLTALEQAAVSQGLSQSAARERLGTLLQRFLAGRGLSAAAVSNAEVQDFLFPDLDEALRDVLPEDIRREALRQISEQLVAEQLGAQLKPRVAGVTVVDTAATQWSEDDLLAEDVAFDEDEFELDDPEYLEGPQSRSFDLGDAADQTALIRLLGRVSGVRSVMICRRDGEVVQARSVSDLTKLGSVVAATIMLLRGQALRLLSAQVGGQTVCVRPLEDYAVAVLAGPDVNIGRLLTELSNLQGSPAAGAGASAGAGG